MPKIFDDMYSKLTERVNYKLLFLVPVILAAVMIFLIILRGIPLGIDFQGGTLIKVTLDTPIDTTILNGLRTDLESMGLEDLRIYLGRERVTGENILTIKTLTFVNKTRIFPILESHLGELSEIDIVTTYIIENIPPGFEDKLKSRLGGHVDVQFDRNTSLLRISAYELDEKQIFFILQNYLSENLTVNFEKKNFNMKVVGPTLGKAFREQGMGAIIIAYILIILVIFIAFRDFVPSIAVILAATFDALFAAGGMSLFGITLEPASLVAIIMLVGYSVDTDILLTTRVLKTRTGTVNERIDNAMKTGLTMTTTTLCVMFVILIISTQVIKIDIMADISSVLLVGLIGDIISTWFMNAGILKWYMEEKGGKIRIRRVRI